MNDSSGQRVFSATLAVAAFGDAARSSRARASSFLVLCLLAHLCVLAFLLWEDWRLAREAPRVVEEIPVEVITEPPAPKQEEPPRPSRRSRGAAKTKQKPPPPPPPLEDEKPAFDAPKAESKSKSEVNAPEQKESRRRRTSRRRRSCPRTTSLRA